MRLTEIRDRFDRDVDFPVDRESLIAQVGDVDVDVPTGETASVREILDRTDETVYRSADDAYDALVGNVDDRFIGRKYYDDRGGVRFAASVRTRSDPG